MSAVQPSLFLAFLSAPAASSACTISVWPGKLASMSAVKPSLFLASLSAPAASSACAISVWPWKLARMSAVKPPLLSLASLSAPAASSACTVLASPAPSSCWSSAIWSCAERAHGFLAAPPPPPPPLSAPSFLLPVPDELIRPLLQLSQLGEGRAAADPKRCLVQCMS